MESIDLFTSLETRGLHHVFKKICFYLGQRQIEALATVNRAAAALVQNLRHHRGLIVAQWNNDASRRVIETELKNPEVLGLLANRIYFRGIDDQLAYIELGATFGRLGPLLAFDYRKNAIRGMIDVTRTIRLELATTNDVIFMCENNKLMAVTKFEFKRFEIATDISDIAHELLGMWCFDSNPNSVFLATSTVPMGYVILRISVWNRPGLSRLGVDLNFAKSSRLIFWAEFTT